MLNGIFFFFRVLVLMLQDHGTATSRTASETGRGGTTTAMMEEETASAIAMMTGTVETSIEEVCLRACSDPLACMSFMIIIRLSARIFVFAGQMSGKN